MAKTVLGGMLAALLSSAALAQAPVENLEEIVVTVDPQEEGDRRVAPVGDVVGPETLRERGAGHVREIMELMPNVTLVPADGGRAMSFAVRGSGEISFHEYTGGRGGVAFYVDDVPFTDVYARDLAMAGVTEISLFKGPHGTAFGAPGAVGVLDARIAPPEEEWHGELSQTYGSHDFFRTTFGAGGKIAPGLFLDIDGLYSRSDGWFTDRLTGDDYGRSETFGGTLRLRWVPSEQLDFTFTAGIQRHDDHPAVYLPFRADDIHRFAGDSDAFATGGQHYQALKAVWKGEGWQLKSITSHRRSDFDDSDNALLLEIFDPFSLQRQREQDVRAWTQEIRLESTDPAAVWRWRTGLFYGHRDSVLEHFILALGPWEGENGVGFRQNDLALYGELTRRIGEKLEITGGLRLQSTWDRTRSDFVPTAFAESLGATGFEMERSERFDGVLPSFSVAWKWSENQRTHVRVAAGMQPGGLAVAAAGSRDYDSEHSLHYEIGHAASFMDGRVSLHTAVFYTDYRDYQSFEFNPAGQVVYNASAAHAWGGEIALVLRPVEELEFSASAGWTKGEFDDFVTPFADYSGKRIDNIPRFTANLSAAYRAKWGGVARLDWRHTGSTAFDQSGTVRQGGYSVFDARVGYENERFGAFLFARNLGDKEYYTHSYLFRGVPAASVGTPRIVGAEIAVKF